MLSEGSSDRALLPILRWLLIEVGYTGTLEPQWADLRLLPNPPTRLVDRIRRSAELYPCDLLFLHRDADHRPPSECKRELLAACEGAFQDETPPAVCVVPVRMTEAWLLIDEQALRRAAGRPSAGRPLDLPPLQRLEKLPDPKDLLYRLLLEASGATGRRRRKFHVQQRVHRLADLVQDWSPLRTLPAFRELEVDLRHTLEQSAWLPAGN